MFIQMFVRRRSFGQNKVFLLLSENSENQFSQLEKNLDPPLLQGSKFLHHSKYNYLQTIGECWRSRKFFSLDFYKTFYMKEVSELEENMCNACMLFKSYHKRSCWYKSQQLSSPNSHPQLWHSRGWRQQGMSH